MNNNDDFLNKKLSHIAMQELLTDYVFNKLSNNEKEIFERNISNFPDLEAEVFEISKVFKKVSKYDYNSLILDRSKNISVKVLNKSNKKGILGSKWIWKIAVPVCLIITLGYAIGRNFDFDISLINKNDNAILSHKPVLKTSESKILFNDLTNEELSESVETDNLTNQQSNNDIEAEKLINEFLNSNYELTKEKYNTDFNNQLGLINNPNVMMNELNDLSEEEFQILMESMEDVEIES